MLNKLIIHNKSDLSMSEAIDYCRRVVNSGYVSESNKGKKYRSRTKFSTGIIVFSEKNNSSDTLVVMGSEINE